MGFCPGRRFTGWGSTIATFPNPDPIQPNAPRTRTRTRTRTHTRTMERTEAAADETRAPIKSTPLDKLEARTRAFLARVAEMQQEIQAIHDADTDGLLPRLELYIEHPGHRQEPVPTDGTFAHRAGYITGAEQLRRIVDAHAWGRLVKIARVADFMPRTEREKLQYAWSSVQDLYKTPPPEFTQANIEATISGWTDRRGSDTLQSVYEIWRMMAKRSSNPAHGFAKRNILRMSALHSYYGTDKVWLHNNSELREIVRVLLLVAQGQMPTPEQVLAVIPQYAQMGSWSPISIQPKGPSENAQALGPTAPPPVADIKPHKNMNLWLDIRPDVLAGLNRLLAKGLANGIGEKRVTK